MISNIEKACRKNGEMHNKIKLSNWVIYMRKQSLSPVHKFAKDHNISSSLVKKYESGEYDEPSPLIASNFCKHFAITPDELVNKCKLSEDENFNKEEYLQTLKSYYYNSPQNNVSINSIEDYLDLTIIDQFSKTKNCLSSFNIPHEVVFEGKHKNRIVGAYFKYEKVHKNQRILDAYKYLADSIANAALVRLTLVDPINHAPYLVKNYLFVVSSKNAFNAIFDEKNLFFANTCSSGINSPVNIVLLLLPKYNSKNYYYFNVIGDDFIKVQDHYYSTKNIIPNNK